MNGPSPAPAILIVGHGSQRPEATHGFLRLAERIAGRLPGLTVLPTFFSIAAPSIPERLAQLDAQGCRHVILMPYFLYNGQHITKDIPALLEECRRQYPHLTLEMLPTLEDEPALEDVVVDRLAGYLDADRALPNDGPSIQRRSFEIIERQLGSDDPANPARKIVRRIVHASADFSYARTLRIHPQAVERGLSALRAGKPIICDVRMLQAGITLPKNPVLCAIRDPAVLERAKSQGGTRAAAAMEHLAPQMEGAIVAIGNAPTALWKVLELARQGGPRPALVVGLPVGFVGARESKIALSKSDLCYITNLSAKGGSPVAAAAVNALAALDKEKPNHAV